MNTKYDAIIVGMGPSGVFCAYELIRLGKANNILMIEQGKRVEQRKCVSNERQEGVSNEKQECASNEKRECVKCKPHCHITTGFSGAGAFSDGKLSLYNPEDDKIYVGGDLADYIGVTATKELIDYTDKIYLEFGADPHTEGTEYKDEVAEIKKKAKEQKIDLINIPIRHLGTEKAKELYKRIQDYLLASNVEMRFETNVTDLIIEDGIVRGVIISNAGEEERIYSANVVMAVGRNGANWLSKMCEKHNIMRKTGTVDLGIRYEVSDEIMKDVNKYMYEGKFVAYPEPYKDKVRTFCQNPSGFVSQELYDEDGTMLVNGHAYKKIKSTNTNFSILVSHNFKEPFNKTIQYGINIAKNANELGNGNVLVQRLGDILRGKRTWSDELASNSLQPTLTTAEPGDISYALDYRTLTNILQFIKDMDKVIPGFANPENLLYAPEIKFYSNRLVISKDFESVNISGLYSIGDGGGLTRGLMQASCSGVKMARILAEKI